MTKISELPGPPEAVSGMLRDGGGGEKRALDEESRMFRDFLEGPAGDGKNDAPAGQAGGKTDAVPSGPAAPAPGEGRTDDPESAGGRGPDPGDAAAGGPGTRTSGRAGTSDGTARDGEIRREPDSAGTVPRKDGSPAGRGHATEPSEASGPPETGEEGASVDGTVPSSRPGDPAGRARPPGPQGAEGKEKLPEQAVPPGRREDQGVQVRPSGPQGAEGKEESPGQAVPPGRRDDHTGQVRPPGPPGAEGKEESPGKAVPSNRPGDPAGQARPSGSPAKEGKGESKMEAGRLREGKNGGTASPREEGAASPPEGREGVPAGAGDALLRFLQGTTAGRPPEGPAGPGKAAETLSAAAREIADRILVSGKVSGGREEVRIFLKERILAGTEVRISVDAGGLRVDLFTTSADSHAFLSGRTDDLARVLKDRVGEDVVVNLNASEAGREEGEGRSRQRRSVYDEWER